MSDSLTHSWEILLYTLSSGLKDWGSLHPIVVHLPIALLFVVPVFIVLGLIFKKSSKALYVSALVLLILGTASIYLAVLTGEKASELITPNSAILETLETHDHLALKMRLNFSILTAVFLAFILLMGPLAGKIGPKIRLFGLIVYLAVFSLNLIMLLNTAHQGGKLVHQHGITSDLYHESKHNK